MRFLILFLLSASAWSANENKCFTTKGIRLDQDGLPYTNVNVRNQGKLGTCFAWTATDLVKSYLKLDADINIFEAAVRGGAVVNGGSPHNLVDVLGKGNSVCTNPGALTSMFPSKEVNVITELKEVLKEYPAYFGGEMKDVAQKILRGEIKGSSLKDASENGLKQFLYYKDLITKEEAKIKDWKDKQSIFNTKEYNNRLKGYVSNSTNIEIPKFKKLADEAHDKYSSGSEFLIIMKNRLSDVSTIQAGEIIAYWTDIIYPGVVSTFKKYGVAAHLIPTKAEFVEYRDKDTIFAGPGYANFLVSISMEKICAGKERTILPKFKANSYDESQWSLFEAKIDHLLSKNKPQGIALTIDAYVLQSTQKTDDTHALQIIGCRMADGKKQYLLKNSWGNNCTGDDCVGDKVWFNSNMVLYHAKEITWIESIKEKLSL